MLSFREQIITLYTFVKFKDKKKHEVCKWMNICIKRVCFMSKDFSPEQAEQSAAEIRHGLDLGSSVRLERVEHMLIKTTLKENLTRVGRLAVTQPRSLFCSIPQFRCDFAPCSGLDSIKRHKRR